MGSSGVSTERGRPVLAATLAAWFLLPVGAGGAAPSDQLSLVDDRGEPLGSPVEICLVQGLPPAPYLRNLRRLPLRRTSEDWVGQGLPQGHAGSVTVVPEQTLELEILVENAP
jgi:hypothetical protein